MPEIVVRFEKSRHGFEGFLVIDSTVLGPASGGVRILPDVTEEEVKTLARAMTCKNAFYNLPAGGGKAGIVLDPQSKHRDDTISAFALAVSDWIRRFRYVPSPDIGSTETEILRIFHEAGADSLLRSSARLKTIDGMPLANLTTAEGVVEAVLTAARIAHHRTKGATVAVEGFGRLGSLIAVMLAELGLKIVAVSNIEHSLLQETGIDVCLLAKIQDHVRERAFETYATSNPTAELCSQSVIAGQPVDVLIPAARPWLITESNADRIQARIIVPCANAPVDESAERPLSERGILVVPDFVSNAGGVMGGFLSRLSVPQQRLRSIVREQIKAGVTTVLNGCGNKTPGEYARRVVAERLNFAERHRTLSRLAIVWHWRRVLASFGGVSALSWYARHRPRT